MDKEALKDAFSKAWDELKQDDELQADTSPSAESSTAGSNTDTNVNPLNFVKTSATDIEHIRLFFSAANDQLSGKEPAYLHAPNPTPAAVVDSAELQAELTKVEAFIESSTSVAALRDTFKSVNATETAPTPPPTKSIQTCNLTTRIVATAIDLLIASTIAALVASSFIRGEPIELLLSTANTLATLKSPFDSQTSLDLVTFLIVCAAALPLSSIVYLAVSTPLFKNSIGGYLCGLRVQDRAGRKPSAAQRLIRILLAPLEVLFVGLLPLLCGKDQSLQDAMSRCVVVKR